MWVAICPGPRLTTFMLQGLDQGIFSDVFLRVSSYGVTLLH